MILILLDYKKRWEFLFLSSETKYKDSYLCLRKETEDV